MSGTKWKKYKLSELGFLGRGKSKHRPRNDASLFGGKYPFIQTGEIKSANFYITEYSQTYNEKGLKQSKLWNEDTLCITIAANIAETAILKIKACFPDSIVGFIANPKLCDARYIKYYIDYIKTSMQNISGGACQDNLSLDKIGYFDILTPELKTQEKIAKVLSNYDELIENNNKHIKILEEMAQKIYKEWFVDLKFPENENINLKQIELGKLLKIPKGKNITKSTIQEGSVPVVAAGLTPAYYHNQSNTIAPVVTISASGANAGYVNIYYQNVWVSDCSYIDKSTTDYVYYHYLLLKDNQIEITKMQRGAAQPHVYPEDLSRLLVYNIPEESIQKFENIIASFFESIKNLSLKNETLKQTRDLLLPRLISGEIDVENLEIL